MLNSDKIRIVSTIEQKPNKLGIALRFNYHRLRHELTNYSLVKSRDVDGQIVSQHQSGTHWLKFMLANALSHQYGLPPPQYNHANDFIGGPKDAIVHPNIPRLISSHSIPPIAAAYLVNSGKLNLPKYVLLVRDIRASLVSNFRKWENRYAVSFSEFLRGDPSGRKYNSDLWWSIRFLNAWHRLSHVPASEILTVRYESLQQELSLQLNAVNDFLDLKLSVEAITAGIESASKTEMKSRADPERPKGEVHESVVDPFEWFNSSDRAFLTNQCDKFLRFDFGYDYRHW